MAEVDYRAKPLRTETIDGTKIPIYVTEEGRFGAKFDGDRGGWVEADSLKELIGKITTRLRRKAIRVSIPASLLHEGKRGWQSQIVSDPAVEAITITGMHARTRKPLITRADGTKETLDSYDLTLARRLTAEEARVFVQRVLAQRDAAVQLKAFVDSVVVRDGEKFITEAAAKAGTPVPAALDEED